MDGRVGEELERPDDEEEHAHYGEVATEGLGEGEFDFGLDFESVDFGVGELEEVVEERGKREDEEEEENVVAVEEVVGFGGGVMEPQCFCGGEGAADCGLRFLDCFVGQHWWRREAVIGGGGESGWGKMWCDRVCCCFGGGGVRQAGCFC